MAKLYDQLMEDHANLARVLKVLEEEIARYGSEERCEDCQPDLPLIGEILEYMHYYPESFHHPLEEAAFNYLIENGICTAQDTATITEQHHKLSEAEEQLREMVNAIDTGTPVPLERLRSHLRDYLDLLSEHIRNEEHDVFPHIRELDEEAERRIRQQVKTRMDPFSSENSEKQFNELLRYIDRTH